MVIVDCGVHVGNASVHVPRMIALPDHLDQNRCGPLDPHTDIDKSPPVTEPSF